MQLGRREVAQQLREALGLTVPVHVVAAGDACRASR